MLLYHGSEKILEKPVYGFGRTDNDYGRGFYCTEDRELAKEWACQSFEENLWKGRPLNRKSALLFVLSEKLMEGEKGESTIRNRLCSIMYV